MLKRLSLVVNLVLVISLAGACGNSDEKNIDDPCADPSSCYHAPEGPCSG